MAIIAPYPCIEKCVDALEGLEVAHLFLAVAIGVVIASVISIIIIKKRISLDALYSGKK